MQVWGASTQSHIAGQGMGGLFPAWMHLSLLSLSLLGTGSPDAGPVIQEHHTLWALKLHTELPPSKCVRRGVCHVLCSQLPDTWLPWGVGRLQGQPCKRDLAEGLAVESYGAVGLLNPTSSQRGLGHCSTDTCL